MTDMCRVIDGLRKAAEELARYAPMKVNGRCQVYFDIAIHTLKEQEESIPVSWLTEKLEGHPEIPYAVTDGINHVLTMWKER